MEAEAYEELHRLELGHWWYRGMRTITDQVLRQALAGRDGLRILDAGCGIGGNLTALSTFGKTFGIDYSPLALGYAREAHVGKIAQATVEALPYAANSFDLVTSFDVLYAREVHDDGHALAEFQRVLRPGGTMLLRLPALPILRGPHDTVVHGLRRYTASEVRQKMERANLLPLRVTYLNSLLMPLVFAIRYVQTIRVQRGAVPHSDVNETPLLLNTALQAILRLEAAWIGAGRRFPIGVSVLCLAIKPTTSI